MTKKRITVYLGGVPFKLFSSQSNELFDWKLYAIQMAVEKKYGPGFYWKPSIDGIFYGHAFMPAVTDGKNIDIEKPKERATIEPGWPKKPTAPKAQRAPGRPAIYPETMRAMSLLLPASSYNWLAVRGEVGPQIREAIDEFMFNRSIPRIERGEVVSEIIKGIIKGSDGRK